MLRVTTERRGQAHILGLHGTLGGEWVTVLEQHWRSISDAVPLAKIILVLSEVEFIDSDGEQLLARMADGGVEFVASGCMNRYVVEKLQQAPRARGHEGVLNPGARGSRTERPQRGKRRRGEAATRGRRHEAARARGLGPGRTRRAAGPNGSGAHGRGN
jgi:hypothetical protein